MWGQRILKSVSGSKFYESEVESLKDEVHTKRFLKYGILGLGLISATVALFNPKLPDGWKLSLMFNTALCGGAVAMISRDTEEIEKRFNAYVEINRSTVKQEDINRLTKKNITDEVSLKYNLAQSFLTQGFHPAVLENLSNRYDIPIGFFADVMATPHDNQSHVDLASPASINKFNVESYQKFVSDSENIDLSWLTSKFISGSKIVVGARGKGKSTFLTYAVSRMILENPGLELYIIDPHLDRSEPIDYKWFSGVPIKSTLNKVLFKDKYEGLLLSIAKIFQHRIDNDIFYPKSCSLIHLVVDELEAVKGYLGSNYSGLFLDLLAKIQDEGRKYGIEVTVGSHGMKKETIGIDSSALSQMNWVLFENAAYDTTVKYPSDFDQKEIKEKAKLMQKQYEGKKCKIVVVLDQEKNNYFVVPLPLLKPHKISIDISSEEKTSDETQDKDINKTTSEDIEIPDDKPRKDLEIDEHPSVLAFKKIKTWCIACKEKYDRYPSREAIGNTWRQETGQVLSKDALNLLIEKLGIDL
jgi:hypothetical protein